MICDKNTHININTVKIQAFNTPISNAGIKDTVAPPFYWFMKASP
jgi:hypothetical protein